MNNDTKELLIKKVETYSSGRNQAQSHIIGNIFNLGTMAIVAVASNVTLSNMDGTPLITVMRTLLNLGIGGHSLSVLRLLAQRIALKIGLDAKLEFLEEFFTQHGLILEDEVSISKEQGKMIR